LLVLVGVGGAEWVDELDVVGRLVVLGVLVVATIVLVLGGGAVRDDVLDAVVRGVVDRTVLRADVECGVGEVVDEDGGVTELDGATTTTVEGRVVGVCVVDAAEVGLAGDAVAVLVVVHGLVASAVGDPLAVVLHADTATATPARATSS
jgi:hypothetical protein